MIIDFVLVPHDTLKKDPMPAGGLKQLGRMIYMKTILYMSNYTTAFGVHQHVIPHLIVHIKICGN
jgi:hypothetical protein